jgi:hypothetical protein
MTECGLVARVSLHVHLKQRLRCVYRFGSHVSFHPARHRDNGMWSIGHNFAAHVRKQFAFLHCAQQFTCMRPVMMDRGGESLSLKR